jgi:hypothetical protein
VRVSFCRRLPSRLGLKVTGEVKGQSESSTDYNEAGKTTNKSIAEGYHMILR